MSAPHCSATFKSIEELIGRICRLMYFLETLTVIPRKRTRESGVTLIELMVTVIVIGILATIAVPSFSDFLARQRVVDAATSLSTLVQYARTETLKTDSNYSIDLNDISWCFGVTASSAVCDCTASPANCLVDGVSRIDSSSNHPGVTMASGTGGLVFDSRRGTVSGAGNVLFIGSTGMELRVDVTPLGRSSICTPNSGVSGYPSC